MKRTFRLRAALFACVACLVGCDHASKLAAQVALRDRGPVLLMPGLDLSYVENRGIAFDALSLLSLRPPLWALTTFTMAAAVAVSIVWARRRLGAWSDEAAFALVSAGALGNAMDRLVRGHVVDFIHVHFWPVFNVADVLIVTGMSLLVLGRVHCHYRSKCFAIGSK